MIPTASLKDTKSAPTTASQARASSGLGASPARSPRAFASVKDEPAHENSLAKEDKIHSRRWRRAWNGWRPAKFASKQTSGCAARSRAAPSRRRSARTMVRLQCASMHSSIQGGSCRTERHSREHRHRVKSTRRSNLQYSCVSRYYHRSPGVRAHRWLHRRRCQRHLRNTLLVRTARIAPQISHRDTCIIRCMLGRQMRVSGS